MKDSVTAGQGILLVTLLVTGAHTATLEMVERRVIYAADDRTSAPHNQLHFPQLEKLGNGLTLLCYGTRVEGNRSLWARVSIDGGRQSEEPFRIFKGTGKVYANVQLLDDHTFRVVYDESPAERPDGTIYNAIVRVVIRAKGDQAAAKPQEL